MQLPGGHGAAVTGHSAKHSRSKKHVHGKGGKHHPKKQKQQHHQHGKQHVHTVAQHAKNPRGLAIGSLLPVFSFEALAMSLRLAGGAVCEDDMLGLWDLCGRREVSIAEALLAATEYGVAGVRLTSYDLAETYVSDRSPLLLGVDVPGPHAVLATPDGWWSWGSLWLPWTSAVSEAWVISWL